MLDEVDAPLDDANVDRFCSMMEEMSRSTEHALPRHHPPPDDHEPHEPAVRRDDAGEGHQPACVGGLAGGAFGTAQVHCAPCRSPLL